MNANWLLDQIDVIRWTIDNRLDRIADDVQKARPTVNALLQARANPPDGIY